jgi:hypothetical protein
MAFICDGKTDELGEYGDEEKIRLYIERYIPFFDGFRDAGIPFDLKSDGVPGRKVDRALMAFGQAIRIPASNLPKP